MARQQKRAHVHQAIEVHQQRKSARASSNCAHIHIRKDTLILCLRKDTRTLAHTYIHTSDHTHSPTHTSQHALAYGNARTHTSVKHTYSHAHILSPICIFLRDREREAERERERKNHGKCTYIKKFSDSWGFYGPCSDRPTSTRSSNYECMV